MSYSPVPVWSRAQRMIHWAIAFSVLLLIPLGALILSHDLLELTDESTDFITEIHASIGLVFGVGAVSRLAYLFTGPASSRWRDVVPHTRAQWAEALATVRYYLSGFRGKAPLYLSHNAFAGIFDTILFVFMATQAASGATMFFLHGEGHEHSAGAGAMEAGPPEWMEAVHAIGAGVIVLFVMAHFTALAAHDIVERRGLVSSMISGSKFFDDEEKAALDGQIKEKALEKPLP